MINAREKHDIEIRFNPKIRVNQFKKEIYYKVVENEEAHRLLIC